MHTQSCLIELTFYFLQQCLVIINISQAEGGSSVRTTSNIIQIERTVSLRRSHGVLRILTHAWQSLLS